MPFLYVMTTFTFVITFITFCLQVARSIIHMNVEFLMVFVYQDFCPCLKIMVAPLAVVALIEIMSWEFDGTVPFSASWYGAVLCCRSSKPLYLLCFSLFQCIPVTIWEVPLESTFRAFSLTLHPCWILMLLTCNANSLLLASSETFFTWTRCCLCQQVAFYHLPHHCLCWHALALCHISTHHLGAVSSMFMCVCHGGLTLSCPVPSW